MEPMKQDDSTCPVGFFIFTCRKCFSVEISQSFLPHLLDHDISVWNDLTRLRSDSVEWL
jgi:hypothetical protein